MENHYNNQQEIEAVVAGFEKCTIGKEGFTHLSHLTVATYYLRHSTPDEACERMRDGLFGFLDHHGEGRSKYKEQLTRDWIALIRGVIEKMDPKTNLVDATNEVLKRLGKPRIAPPANHETL